MRSRIRLGLITAIVVASVSVTGYALAASVGPKAFAPVGTSRYAMVSKGPTSIAQTTSTTFVDMPDMSTTITVPSGKTAEVIVTFSAMVNTCDAMYVRAMVGGSAASPGYTQFMWDLNGGAESHAFTFYRSVNSGTHTVKIQWRGLSTCAQQFVAARSMVVTANVH